MNSNPSHEELCELALKEICKDEVTYLHKEDYLPWLEKYKYLVMKYYLPDYRVLIGPQHFNQFYYMLNFMACRLPLTDLATQANMEYALFDPNDKVTLRQWFDKYEKLSDDVHSIIETNLNEDENEEEYKTGYVSVDFDYPTKIAVCDYFQINLFLANHHPHILEFLD